MQAAVDSVQAVQGPMAVGMDLVESLPEVVTSMEVQVVNQLHFEILVGLEKGKLVQDETPCMEAQGFVLEPMKQQLNEGATSLDLCKHLNKSSGYAMQVFFRSLFVWWAVSGLIQKLQFAAKRRAL